MAAHSKVILFDEPTSALDPEWVDEVLGLMKELARQHQAMREAALRNGMTLMRDDGERLVRLGLSTREELIRVTRD
jgi:putative amino-acid transport system ATP-binding protein